jgi:hypothetical protein
MSGIVGYVLMLTAKADNRRRVQIPNIKAGQVFSVENDGSGVIVLHELRPIELAEVETLDALPKKPGKISNASIREAILAGRR